VIKSNANQRYTTTAETAARFMGLCEKAGVPCQQYAHRSDLGCGSTIGPMVAAQLGIASVDVGSPLWAMHSARESAGTLDHGYMIAALTAGFRSRVRLPPLQGEDHQERSPLQGEGHQERSLPFKGEVGVGMGSTSTAQDRQIIPLHPIPLPTSPLKGEEQIHPPPNLPLEGGGANPPPPNLLLEGGGENSSPSHPRLWALAHGTRRVRGDIIGQSLPLRSPS